MPKARRRGAGATRSATLIEQTAAGRGAGRRGAQDRRALRHRRVRPKDGAAVRAAARDLARDRPRGYPEGGPQLPDDRETMTIDRHERRGTSARDAAWPGGSARQHDRRDRRRAAAWALSVDFAKASAAASSATARPTTPSATASRDDFDFEYRRDDLVRVWQEFPVGPEGHLPEARHASGSHLFYAQGLHLSAARGAVRLAVRHQRLPRPARAADDGVLRVRVRVPGRAQPSGRGADLRVRVPVRVARAGLHGAAQAGLLHLRDRPDRVFLLVLQGSRSGRRAESARPSWRTRWLLAPRSDVVAAVLARHRDVREADQHRADRAAAGVGGAAQAVARGVADRRRSSASSWRRCSR